MEKIKDIVISKEEAVFWMDGNGRWHNEHGPFRHKKLIDYFNVSIGWDSKGFFVGQVHGDIREKVYFRYEDTALFAVDIDFEAGPSILLNTRKIVELQPQKLCIKNDRLFMDYQDIRIKFTDRCMMRLSKYIEEIDGSYYFRFNDQINLLPAVD